MQTTIDIHILIHILTIGCALVALWLAVRSYSTSPRKVVLELVQLLDDTEARIDRLEGMWKKLNANYASLRANITQHKNGSEHDLEQPSLDTDQRPGESKADHKERLRKLMRAGRFKHGADAYPGD